MKAEMAVVRGRRLAAFAFAALCASGLLARERKVVMTVEGGDSDAEAVAFLKKNALGNAANGHPVAYVAKPGAGPLHITVADTNGATVYEGGDKNEAVVAMVDTLTNLPVPGQLIAGVPLKKFRQYRKRLVMGVKAEGYALAPFKNALKSRKPEEVAEAQAILDSIEKAKKRLAEDIKDDLEAGDKGMALRDIRWYITTWPSERAAYEADFKRLSADQEAVKAERAWFAARKNRK